MLQNEASVRREVVSYNAAISSCEKGEQWPCALFLFDAMPAADTLAIAMISFIRDFRLGNVNPGLINP